MRTLLILIAGVVIGATAFHAYYLRQSQSDRCIWDHPLDEGARSICRVMRSGPPAADQDPAARQEMDRLIENVSR